MSCSYPARHALEPWTGIGWNHRPACMESAMRRYRKDYTVHSPRSPCLSGAIARQGITVNLSSLNLLYGSGDWKSTEVQS